MSVSGVLSLGFKELNDEDLHKILTKLSITNPRERRARKCRRTCGTGLGKILANIPSNVWELNVVGNRNIGDAGMLHLHLLPKSVTYLDLSDCNLTPLGIERVCSVLKTNESITRLIMWGNKIGDEGAKYVADMLAVNKTSRSLCIMGSEIGPVGFAHLSNALKQNSTLRSLDTGNDDEVGDEHIQNLWPGLAVNRGLQVLDLMNSNVTETGVGYLEKAMRENVHLEEIELNQPNNGFIYCTLGSVWMKIMHWAQLNRCNRKLIKDVNSTDKQLVDAIVENSDTLDVIFFFVRNKPELCKMQYSTVPKRGSLHSHKLAS
eukprot:scaffold30384_cov53-Attheya_sp.AAC.2